MIVRADSRMNWMAMSQAERDDAYDNNKAVLKSVALIAERNARSAHVRATQRSFLDVPYGIGEREKSDLYPAADASAPCLVFIHGGYWQRNARDVFANMIEGMAAHGWSVAVMGYTLAPEATMTGIIGETYRMLDWLQANGAKYGMSGPIVLSGWSAGAQMAAMALDHPAVTAGLAVSGVYDLKPIRDTGLNKALQLTDEEVRSFSPLTTPVINKPLTIAYGGDELPALVHDARNFHAVRQAAGAPGTLIEIAGANHFSILDALRLPDGELVADVRRLVQTP